jgi:hypothetical protein
VDVVEKRNIPSLVVAEALVLVAAVVAESQQRQQQQY